MPAVGRADEFDFAVAPAKLVFGPEAKSSYVMTDGPSARAKTTRGGLPRTRRDLKGTSAFVEAQWILNSVDYEELKDFYEFYVGRLFRIDLFVDQFYLTEHTAKFVPETFTLTQQKGDAYFVSARLEVHLVPPNEDYDLAFIDMYSAYGDDMSALMSALAIFANTTVDTYL